ncbi:Crp/Fnr family transcriptional regulator [Aestuariivivens sediminicola]|uniref:Crp/Fnr family transcriptional regulator n=1 Tax=Aestuariivivens sediminicola TaxID=2913560 RepID=UPI001F56DB04|nr:Crp/Fnr family transcriptional regulator [Aestuariivivens sediminicola]
METIFCNQHINSNCESCKSQRQFIFRHLDTDQLRSLSNKIEEVHYNPGEVIFKQGTSPQGFICLKKGKVKITCLASNGNEQIIDLKSSPDTLGIRALSTGSRHKSCAIALDQVCICLIPKKTFHELLNSCPNMFRELLSYIGERLNRADQRLISLTQKPMKSRLADTLLFLQKNMGIDSDGYIDIPLKRSELSQLSNMTNSNVIRTLSEFKSKGLIKFKKRKIKIITSKTLSKISE